MDHFIAHTQWRAPRSEGRLFTEVVDLAHRRRSQMQPEDTHTDFRKKPRAALKPRGLTHLTTIVSRPEKHVRNHP